MHAGWRWIGFMSGMAVVAFFVGQASVSPVAGQSGARTTAANDSLFQAVGYLPGSSPTPEVYRINRRTGETSRVLELKTIAPLKEKFSLPAGQYELILLDQNEIHALIRIDKISGRMWNAAQNEWTELVPGSFPPPPAAPATKDSAKEKTNKNQE